MKKSSRFRASAALLIYAQNTHIRMACFLYNNHDNIDKEVETMSKQLWIWVQELKMGKLQIADLQGSIPVHVQSKFEELFNDKTNENVHTMSASSPVWPK